MKKLRLKKGAIIGAYLIAFSLTGMSAFFVSQNMQANNPVEEDIEYVNSSIIDDNEREKEVIKEEIKMIKPYTDENVQTLKYFYDYMGEAKTQEKSILYHENTYIQNSGMDFGLENTFEVVAILDGTVVDVREDELLGTVVEIKHDNDFISSYQSLSEVSVKKNDTIKQGQIIGKSGTNTIDQDLGNHLHFELYKSGSIVDPNKYFNQVISDKEEQNATSNDTTSNNDNTNEETE